MLCYVALKLIPLIKCLSSFCITTSFVLTANPRTVLLSLQMLCVLQGTARRVTADSPLWFPLMDCLTRPVQDNTVLLQVPDLDQVYQRRLKARDTVNAQLTTKALQQAMQQCLPYPCHQRYTAVAMLPQSTLVNRILSSFGTIAPNSSRKQAYWVLATAIGTAGALVAAKLWKRNK